jgi:hypothetical protein
VRAQASFSINPFDRRPALPAWWCLTPCHSSLMRKLPVPDILMLILDRGRMSKDEIQRMWAVTDEEYAALRTRLSAEKLIRPAPGRGGGFEAVFGQRPAAAAD